MAALGPRVCEVGGGGLLLPLFGDVEQELDWYVRVPLYALGLAYLFLGVNVVSDVFMSGIEQITSATVTVSDPEDPGKTRTAKLWNDTVANLTLLALGSSAPEILLSIVEVCKNEFHSGELGPSTIVGSAAFNLLVIIASCVYAIPDGEIRRIKEWGVFLITAAFSIFAYLWLVFIVQLRSPDVIEVWEGALTFAFFPLLVAVSYAADVGKINIPGAKSCDDCEAAEKPLKAEPAPVPAAAPAQPAPAAAPAPSTNYFDYDNGEAEEEAALRSSEQEDLCCSLWCAQVSEAVSCEPDGGWVLRLLVMPWKLLFAVFVPPAEIAGGWACFVVSLGGIGCLTALIGDVAELFGCCAGIEDSITAITLVALGTSLPDLFASRLAALQDEHADASIVNVTGSNSVNVFLGIGMPWLMAACYWQATGATDDWLLRYPDMAVSYSAGAFVVRSGDLAFSVLVFSLVALTALALLHVRRVSCGGELGGQRQIKQLSSMVLVLLWLFYVGLSVWKIKSKRDAVGDMVAAVLMAIGMLAIAFCAGAAVLMRLGGAGRGKAAGSGPIGEQSPKRSGSAQQGFDAIAASGTPALLGRTSSGTLASSCGGCAPSTVGREALSGTSAAELWAALGDLRKQQAELTDLVRSSAAVTPAGIAVQEETQASADAAVAQKDPGATSTDVDSDAGSRAGLAAGPGGADEVPLDDDFHASSTQKRPRLRRQSMDGGRDVQSAPSPDLTDVRQRLRSRRASVAEKEKEAADARRSAGGRSGGEPAGPFSGHSERRATSAGPASRRPSMHGDSEEEEEDRDPGSRLGRERPRGGLRSDRGSRRPSPDRRTADDFENYRARQSQRPRPRSDRSHPGW